MIYTLENPIEFNAASTGSGTGVTTATRNVAEEMGLSYQGAGKVQRRIASKFHEFLSKYAPTQNKEAQEQIWTQFMIEMLEVFNQGILPMLKFLANSNDDPSEDIVARFRWYQNEFKSNDNFLNSWPDLVIIYFLATQESGGIIVDGKLALFVNQIRQTLLGRYSQFDYLQKDLTEIKSVNVSGAVFTVDDIVGAERVLKREVLNRKVVLPQSVGSKSNSVDAQTVVAWIEDRTQRIPGISKKTLDRWFDENLAKMLELNIKRRNRDSEEWQKTFGIEYPAETLELAKAEQLPIIDTSKMTRSQSAYELAKAIRETAKKPLPRREKVS